MELLRISDSKLKVTLSPSDMERFRLDNESMDYENTETRSAIWQILDEAKRCANFDVGGERIFLQVYPSRSGGCEMYVTKVGEEGAHATEAPPPAAKRGRVSVFCFETLELLTTVCRKLCELGYCDESAVYHTEGGYYLMIREQMPTDRLGYRAVGEYPFLEEYGERRREGILLSYLREHGECLCREEAVRDFAGL